jgi:hypothetical protein
MDNQDKSGLFCALFNLILRFMKERITQKRINDFHEVVFTCLKTKSLK